MTDWNKLKVTELREELKARGIPLAGLKLKQQLIDKLLEVDAEKLAPKDDVEQDKDEGVTAKPDDDPTTEAETSGGAKSDKEEAPAKPATDKQVTDLRPPTMRESKSQILPKAVDAEYTEITGEEDSTLATKSVDEGCTIFTKPVNENASIFYHTDTTQQENAAPLPEKLDVVVAATNPPLPGKSPKDTPPLVPTESSAALTSPPTPPEESIEDSKKRKRRSATPPPNVEEMAQKRAKASNGTPAVKKTESSALEQIQVATDAAEAVRQGREVGDKQAEEVDLQMNSFGHRSPNAEARISQKAKDAPVAQETEEHQRPSSPLREDVERHVTPAIHPATSSLYVRNFKRPLHLPTLRSYVSSLAGNNSTSDPVRVFYLDPIRTHAFIGFSSISGAARVRSAMHDSRFPDEKTRDPLWVDFVPDEKVQEWIDLESGARGSGRGSSTTKWEIIYHQMGDGVETVLQEVGDMRRPSVVPSQRQASLAEAPGRGVESPAGVHPDRAALVPELYDRDLGSSTFPSHTPSHREDPRRQVSIPKPPAAKDIGGKGFKALDELFPSTTAAKPKLYYKPVSAAITEHRLGLIKDLRASHSEMGKSGDEGMKRYTFERRSEDRHSSRDPDKDEQWVDKGPEFGYGQRGVDRLAGRGDGGGYRGRGGYRGGGGYGRERGGWRGR